MLLLVGWDSNVKSTYPLVKSIQKFCAKMCSELELILDLQINVMKDLKVTIECRVVKSSI